MQMVRKVAYNGLDVVIIDNKHGILSAESVEHRLPVTENAGVTPLVPASILKAVDRGTRDVLVSQLKEKEQVIKVVRAVKYPILRKRDATFSMRGGKIQYSADTRVSGTCQYSKPCLRPNRSGKAMDNLKEILSVEGIDMVFIGPTDLFVSMGFEGSIDHTEVLKNIDKIYQVTRE